ncbi:MAG: MmgE/PrpD family protein [Rhodospirillaceae bacterium]|jgi:2-methylcitrate dehydratase
MKTHEVRVHPALPWLEKEEHLAWKLAEVATDNEPLDDEAAAMAINRIIDIAGVSVAAINRTPVLNTRTQALAHPRSPGATLIGLPNDSRVECEWVAMANTAASRELDWHDTAYGADASHPCENISAIIAVAQQCGKGGAEVLRGILTAYEVHLCLAKGLKYRPYKMDHQALIGPSVAAGLGTLLGLDTDTVFQAINYATHICLATRQGRKGMPSSWKAYAPGHFAKLGVESVDRAMRGETSPAPIFEGDMSLIATVLGGPDQVYQVPLPEKGEPKRSILESYTKEYSVSSHGQSVVDLARKMKPQISDLEDVEKAVLHFRHESHLITGCGAKDHALMYDPKADKRFLDHSSMYCFAVSLEDGGWNNVANYTPERAQRESTVRLWQRISTVEDDEWNDRFDNRDGLEKDTGLKAVVTMKDGTEIIDEIPVADAHPRGARPFDRPRYIEKFDGLIKGAVVQSERDRYIDLVERLGSLTKDEVSELNIQVDPSKIEGTKRDDRGIF